MKKKIKVILCVVVVLAIVASIVASIGGFNTKNKSASENKKIEPKKTDSISAVKNNKNVKDVKKVENGDSITVTIDGKDTASVTALREVALNTANSLKKENPDKKINVKADFKNQEVENFSFGNKSDESKIYFESKPMYDPVFKCIRFKLHNLNNVSSVQVSLDGKEVKISNDQILKGKGDIFAIKSIEQDFKTGKIILQDKSGNKLEGNF